jgi:hypothetical protein
VTVRHRFKGLIAGARFGPGENVVIGCWRRSPFGRAVDVMWVRPDGRRILLAPDARVADYISGLYAFDEVRTVPVRGGWDGRVVAVEAGPLRIHLEPGTRDWRSWLFAARPALLRRQPWWVAAEDRLARPVVGRIIGGGDGVRAAGVAPGGQREWYSVADYRPVATGELTLDGRGCGPLGALSPRLGVGLSSFPTQPAVVHVDVTVEDRGPSA